MSDIVPFRRRPAPTVAAATKRLHGIWTEVETFVSYIEIERLTPNEMARVLRVFDTANACIRIVLSDFNEEPAITQLVEQSHEIKALIENARERVANLSSASSAVRSA